MKHHWLGETPNPDKYFGFIYYIHNDVTGKGYIGKRQYHRWSKRKKVGEQNWHYYTGSCTPLNKDIKKMGREHFTFVMIEQYYTRGGLVYAETNLQHKLDVLTKKLPDGERAFYNSMIGGIKFVPKEEVSQETLDKLRSTHVKEENEWVNKDGRTFRGSVIEMIELYPQDKLDRHHLRKIVSGGFDTAGNGVRHKRHQHKGWKLKK